MQSTCPWRSAGFVVGHLFEWAFHEGGGDFFENPADLGALGEGDAAEGVHHDAGGVGGVFDGEFHIEFHGEVAEAAHVHADVADFVVSEEGDVVAGADVDRALLHGDLAGDGFGFGGFFAGEAGAFEHVEEVGVAADVELVAGVDSHAALLGEFHEDAVGDGGAELGFDVVADDGEFGFFEFVGPSGFAGDEDGDAVDHGDAGVEAGLGVEFGGFLTADGDVVEQDGGAGFFQDADDVGQGGSAGGLPTTARR